MLKGNTKAALRLISEGRRGNILHLNDTIPSVNNNNSQSVLDILKLKHPPGQPVDTTSLAHGVDNPPTVHPVIFDSINANAIRLAALRTEGAAGPSGIDSHGWRICTAFKSAFNDTCHSLALLARRIYTSFVDPSGLSPLLA